MAFLLFAVIYGVFRGLNEAIAEEPEQLVVPAAAPLVVDEAEAVTAAAPVATAGK